MKRKQRPDPCEQHDVDQNLEALDHCDPSKETLSLLNDEQRKTTSLGNQIRRSAQTDLPPANRHLREMLINELDSQSNTPGKKPEPMTRESNAYRWAIAAMVLLATGLWATLQFSGMTDDENTVVYKYQQLNRPLRGHSLTEDMTIPYIKDDIQLPFLASETESTVVSVPDGGTVMMGGVKSKAEGRSNEGVPVDYLQKPQSSQFGFQGKRYGFQIGGGGFGGGGGGLPSRGLDQGGQEGQGQQGTFRTTDSIALSENGQNSKQIENDVYFLYNGVDRAAFSPGIKLRFGRYLPKQTNNDWGYNEDSKRAQRGEGEPNFESDQKGFEPQRLSGNEQYERIRENQFVAAMGEGAISTFSIDVDTASYANLRRFINSGQLPPPSAVRIEEMINYFGYDYPQPKGKDPFSVNMELATCPWNPEHKLLRIGLKGQDVHRDERPPTNLVFLIDVSGSMTSADKLPLLKRGFQMMVDKLTENDRVSIVTYAGNAGVVLEPTSGDQKKKINAAIEALTPGGSTHGSAGIELAYQMAQKHFISDGVNKVMLATDGDLNVGVTSDDALVTLITQKASEGVFLTVLGFGTGNLKDAKMEKLADNGNGMYAYIDSIREAHKVLVQQMSGSLVTIAKDVKIQIEFNPAEVRGYRLIGYENRMLKTEDFDNDMKDAGEIGAGHTVTALYELITTGDTNGFTNVNPPELKYQNSDSDNPVPQNREMGLTQAAKSGELLTLALRYKEPDANKSKRIEFTLRNDEKSFSSASPDFRFAASVASFGLLLRNSEYAGQSNPAMIQEIASGAMGEDSSGYRAEFIDLVRRVNELCR